MSTRNLLILLGVLLVLGLAIYWRPASQPGSEAPSEDEAVADTSAELEGETSTPTPAPTPTTTTPRRTTTTAPAPVEENDGPSTYLTINYDQDATYAQKAFEVEQGSHVVLRITSSRTDTVVIGGLGLSVPVESDQQSTIEFDADTLGNFTIKLQEYGFTLGTLLIVAAD
jgi:cytoskeletal protein RodZ